MSRSPNPIEYLKIAIAYIGTFGVLLLPIPIIIGLIYKFYGTDWFMPACIGAGFATLPMFYISALTSYKFGQWCLKKWGNAHIK